MTVVPFPSPMSSSRPVRRSVGGSRRAAVPAASPSALPWPVLWLRRWRGRRELATLDLDQIRDADLDPFEVRREAMKPIWRA